MRRITQLNIKGKIVLVATATSALSLLLAGTMGYLYNRIDYRRELAAELASDARFLSFNSAAAVQFDSPEEGAEVLRALQVHPHIIGAAIVDTDGEIFAAYLRNDTSDGLIKELQESPHDLDATGRIHVVEPILANGDVLGSIHVVSDLRQLNARARRSALALGLVLAAGAFFAFIVAVRLQRFISEPVRRLAETARLISEKQDYSLRTKVRSGDELGDLAVQFNHMLEQIQRQDKALRESHNQLEVRVNERTQALEAAKEDAEAASKAKGEFLATMSHELRTPLNGISGMMELISDSELTEEQRERVRVVSYSADALVTIVNDILDFSKIEAGKLELEARPFNLEELLHSVGELLSLGAAENGVDLIAHLDPSSPARVIGDDGRVRQILLNVAGNAVKFTPRGFIRIHVACAEKREGRLRYAFCVEDTGIGITEDKLDSIFETFTQADTSTTRKFGGTGLGLAIARRLVEMMGGRIAMESKIGAGTTVRFSLEFGDCEEGVVERAPVRARVLLLDDEPITRRNYVDMLIHWGISATSQSTDCRELAARYANTPEEEPPELILLNAAAIHEVEPVLEGLRAIPALAAVPCVALGSPARPLDPQQLRHAGADKYIEAYMSPSRLLDAILSVLPGTAAQNAPMAPETAPRPVEGTSLPDREFRILLVEDNVVNQKVATGFLRRMGLTVEIADDGQKAVDRVRSEKFDLIFMDIQMPVMDGFAATAGIRKEPYGERVPIVAMTANAMAEDRDRCLAGGMDDYLAKPLQGKQLRRVIAKYLGNQAADARAARTFLVVSADADTSERINNKLLGRWPAARLHVAQSAIEACIGVGSLLPDSIVFDEAIADVDYRSIASFLQSQERYRSIGVAIWRGAKGAPDDTDGLPVLSEDGELDVLAGQLAGNDSRRRT